jgi:hypothetical protein
MKTCPPIFRPRPVAASLSSILITFLLLVLMLPSVQAQDASRGLGISQSASSSSAAVKEWPGSAKRWALVIGVDKYKDGQISALKGAANDANALAESLVRYAGFPSDQVILMTTSQPDERQPTRVNILRRLSNLASVVPKDGLLLVAFAGHGMERANQAFLLPSDAQISDDVTFLEETAVSVSRMKDRIRATGVAQVVLMLDACRNDPGGRADAPNPLTTAYTRAFNFDIRNREVTAFATLYATAIGQRAYEYTEKKQGYFTWAIVEGLKGGAANEHGEVTLASLLKFVQETVPKRIGIDLGAGKQQRPFAVVEGYRADELVIAVAGKGAAAATTAAAGATETAPAFDPAAMEMSFWESIKNSNDPSDYQAYLDKYPNGTFAALARRRAQPVASSAAATTPVNTAEPPPASSPARGGRTMSVEEMYAQAERDYKDGSLDQVIANTREILAARPDHAQAQALMGLSYYRAGRFANAIASLVKAAQLGQTFNIPIKHHHKLLFDDDLCMGYLTFGKTAFEFHSTSKSGHDFSVPFDKIYMIAGEADRGGRLHVKVGIQKEKKEDKKDYNFHPVAAGLGKEVLANGQQGFTKVFCNNCFAEIQALQQLLQEIKQAVAPGSPLP